MMNLKSIVSTAFIAVQAATTIEAFSLPPHYSHVQLFRHHKTEVRGTVRPDASEAITEALRLSETFGSQSNEARVAWDIVEEMDSNDSTYAYQSKSNNTPNLDAPQDYSDHIRSLYHLLEDTSSKLSQMKILLDQIKELEMKDPALARIPDDAAGGGRALKAALADAKAAVAVYGSSSPEAHEAWDKLDSCFGETSSLEDGVLEPCLELAEECEVEVEPSSNSYRYSAAALKAHHMYNAAIETAVLDESLEALSMIEGLEKFVRVEKRRLDAEEKKTVGP